MDESAGSCTAQSFLYWAPSLAVWEISLLASCSLSMRFGFTNFPIPAFSSGPVSQAWLINVKPFLFAGLWPPRPARTFPQHDFQC